MNNVTALPPIINNELQAIAVRIRDRHQEHLEAVVAIGADLLKAKELVGHGNWLPWLRAEFGWPERTAQTYMSVAERIGTKYEAISYLPMSDLAALASKSTPETVLSDVIERSHGGERIAPPAVRSMIAAAKEEGRRARIEAAQTPEFKRKAAQKRQQQKERWEREKAERTRQDEHEKQAAKHAMEFLSSRLSVEDLQTLAGLARRTHAWRFHELLTGALR